MGCHYQLQNGISWKSCPECPAVGGSKELLQWKVLGLGDQNLGWVKAQQLEENEWQFSGDDTHPLDSWSDLPSISELPRVLPGTKPNPCWSNPHLSKERWSNLMHQILPRVYCHPHDYSIPCSQPLTINYGYIIHMTVVHQKKTIPFDDFLILCLKW